MVFNKNSIIKTKCSTNSTNVQLNTSHKKNTRNITTFQLLINPYPVNVENRVSSY